MTPHNHESGRSSRGSGGRNRPHVEESTLRTEKIQVERKLFIFTLKENARGRFLRITEDVGGRRDHIIVPAPGLGEFAAVVQEIADAEVEQDADELDDERPFDEPDDLEDDDVDD